MDRIQQHISHPDHKLVLVEQKKPLDCKVCSKAISPGSAYYICEKSSDCKFTLHESCSKLMSVTPEEKPDGKNVTSGALDSDTEKKLGVDEKAVNENDHETNLDTKNGNSEKQGKDDEKNGETSNVEVNDGESKRGGNLQPLPVPSSKVEAEVGGNDLVPTKPTAKNKSKHLHKKDQDNNSSKDKFKFDDDKFKDESEDESIKKSASDGPRFSDMGGIRSVLEKLKIEMMVRFKNPDLLRNSGVNPVSGILLHGPPGCGKTKLAHAIANETALPFHYISSTKLISKSSSAGEKLQKLFEEAYRTAPSIVFIDEIDRIVCSYKPPLVTHLLSCMDGSNSKSSDSTHGNVFVIGATNKPNALGPNLRKAGLFDREIIMDAPDENARVEILSVLTRNLSLEGSVDLEKLSRLTPEFVGGDLKKLVEKASNLAISRIIDQKRSELSGDSKSEEHIDEWWKQPYWLPKVEDVENLCIHMADFEEAVKTIQPSSKRNANANMPNFPFINSSSEKKLSPIPDVKWEDVGGLDLLRMEFDRYIIRRIKHPEIYEEFGIDLDTGFLLHGPPGCGKTLIAKAVANESGASFIHIKGPELLNKYVGESERAVRELFDRARKCSPCILFFDEVDALAAKRGEQCNRVFDRVLNQLLIELDGGDKRKGVFVIGATNRRDVMDAAVLRPGRFGKSMYVPLPDADGRALILKAVSRKKPVDASVDFHAFAWMKACEYFSGADLASLINEAAMAALEEKLNSSSDSTTPPTIKTTHFEQALSKVKPSLSPTSQLKYSISPHI